MPRRALVYVIVALVAGILAGSGLAGLAHHPGNDPCLDFGSLPEGVTSSSSSLELWPLGLRCEYAVRGRFARAEFFGPAMAELYAWIAAAALFAGLALLRRDSAAVRGGAAAAVLLGLVGAGWQYAGVQLAFGVTVFPGMPLAFALDHVLRPRVMRSPRRSLVLAIALAALTFCAIFGVVFIPAVGIAFGVLAGAVVSTAVARTYRAPAAAT
ncbi:MAG TPA: hypothetical protein VGV90_16345 [Solirubrobacteraceae bacterium]|nr:hypothetical protein [Solirubrobacteraceae bacterium]